MNSKNPKISILVPSYNHEKYVAFFIDSVLSQSERDFELIIVDDRSSDNTVREIEKYKDSRIKLIKHEFNKGINAGLNSAFAQSSGKYCVFIASDDMLFKNHLEFVSQYMDENPDKDVVYCASQTIDEDNNFIGINKRKNRPKYEILKDGFFTGNKLISPGMTIRKTALDKIMPLDTSILQRQDYKMHMDLLLNGECHITEEPLLYYRIGSQNISKNTVSVINTRDLEESCLMDSFLKIKDVDTLKAIFGDSLKEFGEPVNETIPYFLGRLALTSNIEAKKVWGYHVIMKFINESGNMAMLNSLYGFEFKTFIALIRYFESSRLSRYLAKAKKYKGLFKIAVVVMFLSVAFNMFWLLKIYK